MVDIKSITANQDSYSPEAESHFNDIINSAIKAGKTVCYTHSMINMKPKPMIGSWAAVIRNMDGEVEYSGAMAESRQPRISIYACLNCFKFAAEKSNLLILTNNTYIPMAIDDDQLEKWDHYNWKQYRGGEVKDADLWSQLLAHVRKYKPQVIYIPSWYEPSQLKQAKQLALAKRLGPPDGVDKVKSVVQTVTVEEAEEIGKSNSKSKTAEKKRSSERK